jgi:hypothetical protein
MGAELFELEFEGLLLDDDELRGGGGASSRGAGAGDCARSANGRNVAIAKKMPFELMR